MIDSIILRNFQAHKKLVLEFSPTITVIVGASDVGKSSLIRALTWVCRNEPSGDEFIRHGADSAKVKLIVDDHTINRIRGKEGNLYLLDDTEFKAFGNQVPTPISNLLKLEPINFQQQHDSPFWFGDTSGEVSRQLNQIVNLGIIDDVLSGAASVRRKVQSEIDVTGERIQKAELKAKELENVPTMVDAFEALEQAAAKLEKITQRAKSLSESIQDAVFHRKRVKTASRLIEASTNLLSIGNKLSKVTAEVEVLSTALDDLRRFKERTQKVPDISKLSKAMAAAEESRVRADTLAAWIQDLRIFYKKKKQALKERDDLRKELETLTGGICPVCGNQLHET